MPNAYPPNMFLGNPLPTQPTQWGEVWNWSEDTGNQKAALMAIMGHLGLRLESRWEPGNGVTYRLVPK